MNSFHPTPLAELIGRTVKLNRDTPFSGLVTAGTTGTIIAIEGLVPSLYCAPVKVRFDDEDRTVRYFKLRQLDALTFI